MSLEHVDVLLAALRTLPVVRDLDAHGSQADLVRSRCEKIQTHEPTEPAATLATREREAREAMVCQAAASVEASEVEDLQRWRMAGATPYAIVCDVLAPIERRAAREAQQRSTAVESRPREVTPWGRCWIRLWHALRGEAAEVLVPVEIDTAATMWTDETGERTRQALAVWALERVGPVGGDPNTVRYRRLRVLRGPLADAVVRETGRTMGAAEAAGLTVIDGGRVGRHG